MKNIMRILAGPVLALATSGVLAVGLGDIQVSSALNQPFAATIPVVGASAENLINMTVRLAEPKVFERAGIPRPFLLNRLRFEVVDDGNGNGRVVVSTRERVKEPTLEFIVDADWGKGRTRRSYSVLLELR